MDPTRGPVGRFIRFCVEQKFIVFVVTALLVFWGLVVSPFEWDLRALPRDRVPVDAIPNLGDNQQIVFTEWPGRSPRDIEDQITYPLSSALLGMPGVREVRAQSMMGFSSIYVIFEDSVEFYWSRARVLEKLSSLPAGTLPDGVQAQLGPDATPLGQIFWYTLEGRDRDGNPTGGWDMHELRSIQDWIVRPALSAASGVSEVASVGGHVREYQVDADPDAMRARGVTLNDLMRAVQESNADVGARTLELNRVEYLVRGVGFLKSVEDLENSVVRADGSTPIRVRDVAQVTLGPAERRGALDKEGAEATGGVVAVRFGANPMEVIDNVKAKIDEIAPGLPSKTLEDGTVSRVTIVPFYDRTDLILETLGTLRAALEQQVLITILVVVLMLLHLRSSLLISSMLPLAVLMSFIGMKLLGVEANVVALAGIAIAVGTIVDMGIVISEAILRRLDEVGPEGDRKEAVIEGASEVGSAVLTASATTIISFLPVFALTGAEGKLFTPLAYTKTLALLAAISLTLTLIPAMAHLLFGRGPSPTLPRRLGAGLIAGLGGVLWWHGHFVAGPAAIGFGLLLLGTMSMPPGGRRIVFGGLNFMVALFVAAVLARVWSPLGPEVGDVRNLIFVGVIAGALLLALWGFRLAYPIALRWVLGHKPVVLVPPVLLGAFALTALVGFDTTFGWLPEKVRDRPGVARIAQQLPEMGWESRPSFDEGSFLYMPTTAPHAGIEETIEVLRMLDMAKAAIPEVEQVVGKIGRAESALDPAPLSMVETVINYKPEYKSGPDGRPIMFRIDPETGEHARDEDGELIPDPRGRPYRQWRDHIETPDDIWHEILQVSEIPGTTSAPKLQPIETRLVMLQTGMRAPMGVKVRGPDLETIEATAMRIESLLQEVETVRPETVFADRVVGKPYLEVHIDRERAARHGLTVRNVQDVVEVGLGGKVLTETVEGRERYPVRVRYMRERRDSIESMSRVPVPTPGGAQVPLGEVADIEYVRGPQMIRSEDTFPVAFVIFDGQRDVAPVTVIRDAQDRLREAIETGELELDGGVSYQFAGEWENYVRLMSTLQYIVPVTLVVIFALLFLQFRAVSTALIVFTGVAVAWSGGLILLWMYGQDWFLNFEVLGADLREMFQVGPVTMSAAVAVGFLALFGIATDDGVVMATLLRQRFGAMQPETVAQIREAALEAGKRRVRACVMTTATTMLALLPVLTSRGKGSDIMVPMAIPAFGGMAMVLLSLFIVPCLYALVEEWKLARRAESPDV